MRKRLAMGLILGMSLLFYVILCLQENGFYKAKACTNTENVMRESNASRLAEQMGQTNSAGTDIPQPTSSPTATETPVPADTPVPTDTPAPMGTPGGTEPPVVTQKPTPTLAPTPAPISKGWNETAKGKKYNILKDGKRAKGYRTIDGDGYYFNNKGYAITKQWKYVKLNGKNYKLYFDKNGKRKLDVTDQLKKNTSFRIEVNLSKNMVIIYAKDGNKGYTIPVKAMICSVGMPGHRTITGNYYRLRRAGRWNVLRYNSVGQYCTRISGPYLFHSVVYTQYKDKYSLHKAEYMKLGKSASHGCIRLQVEDAKWIYDRADRCHVTLYYNKKAKYPLAKPKAKKIGKTASKRYYDPTDPKV